MSDEELPDVIEQDPQDEDYREEDDSANDDGADFEEEQVADDESDDDDDDDEEAAETEKAPKQEEQPVEEQPVKRRRGRPPGSGRKKPPKSGRFQPLQIPLDENGKPYEVLDDELVLPEDPAGEEKVDKVGFMKGGREFRVRTFTILGRGQRQYMLATEPARCIGFRDSYLLFQRHRKLLKIKLTDDEKFDLIDRELIPHSYKGRTLGVVTARSVFREFGARVVVGGRRVRDDYYEELAKSEGHTANEIADPDDYVPPEGQQYDKNQYCAWYNAPVQVDAAAMYENNLKSVLKQQTKEIGVNGDSEMVDAVGSDALMPDPELVRVSTASANAFNESLAAGRRKVLDAALDGHGIIDPHTSVRFLPLGTQPVKSRVSKISNKAPRGAVMVSTLLRLQPHNPRLSELDPSVWESADEETKKAIEAQVALEQQL